MPIEEHDGIHFTARQAGDGLSVIVPCFNEGQTVEAILRSLRQRLPSAEIIVVDDGSTDSSLEIVESIADELELRLIAREHNNGKGAAVRANQIDDLTFCLDGVKPIHVLVTVGKVPRLPSESADWLVIQRCVRCDGIGASESSMR